MLEHEAVSGKVNMVMAWGRALHLLLQCCCGNTVLWTLQHPTGARLAPRPCPARAALCMPHNDGDPSETPSQPQPMGCPCGNVLCPLALRGSPQHCPMSHNPCHPTAPRRDGVCQCPGAPCKHTMSARTRACPTAPVPARCVPELGTACTAGLSLQPCALVTPNSHRATCSG